MPLGLTNACGMPVCEANFYSRTDNDKNSIK